MEEQKNKLDNLFQIVICHFCLHPWEKVLLQIYIQIAFRQLGQLPFPNQIQLCL